MKIAKRIFKQIILCLILFGGFLACHSVRAANYYADNQLSSNCAGNYSIASRSCSGADGKAYTTVQAAVNVAIAGDTIYVRSGTYEERVNTYVDGGSEAGRVTIRNYSSESASILTFHFHHNYNTLQGITLVGDPNNAYHTVIIYRNADYSAVINNIIETQLSSAGGVVFNTDGGGGPPDPDAATYCLISGNTIRKINNAQAFIVLGNHNTIADNVITNMTDGDGFYIFGHDNVISENDIGPSVDGPGGNHIDCFQTFGTNGVVAYNIIFERNYCHDMGGQISQLATEGVFEIKDWVIRNNIFINILNGGTAYIPAKWYNNTFYNVDQVSGHALMLGLHNSAVASITNANPGVITTSDATSLGSSGARKVTFYNVGGMTELNVNTYNIAFIDSTHFSIGVDTSGYGAYTSGGTVYEGERTGYEVKNNLFLKCGNNPASASQGWYVLGAELLSPAADYNYVAGAAYAVKSATFVEAHGVNGGNPYLSNEGGDTATDYSLTADSTLVINKGLTSAGFDNDYLGNDRTGNWDIGAYEFQSGVDAIPPTAPSGLAVS